MKTLHLAIIVMTTVTLFSIVLPIEAQCYGCGQNSSALKQGLLEKQLGLTGPPRNTNDISIQDILVQPTTIGVGDTFAINATLVNNSPNTITVKNGCGGPFSIVFDSHAMVEVNRVCNWMAPQIILDPGENITGTSMTSNLDYKAVSPGEVNATVTFSYIAGNKTNLSFDKNSTDISKSFLFAISSQSLQPTRMILSPLEQFKSGTSLEDITCGDGLFLAISNEKNPLCLESGTISKLASRGLLYGAPQDSETTILIPPGSEDPASNKTYSPNVTTVVIGINSTVTWVNQADAGNSIASDTPVVQNLNTFGGSMERPGDSYRYTFTEPGVFHYHGEPHPWQKGIINIISIPIPANLTSQQPNTTNFPQNNTIFGDFYPGIENDSGIVSIKNQTYYMMTASNTTYPIAHGMTVKFHNVTFSFPYGAQTTPVGILIPFDMTFPDGTMETYGNVTKNPDGSGSISGISLGPGPSSNRTITVQSNHMHPQAGVTLTENQIKLLVSTDGNTTITQTPENHTLPTSFEPCQNPYPQKYQGIPTLYMPLNSTGEICVRYHNLNDFPVRIGEIEISEANNLTQDAKDVSTWNDSGNNTISAGNSTIVYWVKTGNHKGLYGLTIFCVPMPFAVGYDNSTLGKSNFPWLGQNTWFCPAELYDFHIDSTTGFKVGYVAEK